MLSNKYYDQFKRNTNTSKNTNTKRRKDKYRRNSEHKYIQAYIAAAARPMRMEEAADRSGRWGFVLQAASQALTAALHKSALRKKSKHFQEQIPPKKTGTNPKNWRQ